MLKRLLIVVLLLAAAAGIGAAMLFHNLRPASGEARFFRIEDGERLGTLLDRLESDGLIQNAAAVRWHYRFFGKEAPVPTGTYLLDPSKNGNEVLNEILHGEAVRQMVLFREGIWQEEVAAILEEKQVASAEKTLELSKKPDSLEDLPPFILPSKGLEGYLYPETYDLPPLIGAEPALQRMLREFEKRVYEPLGKPEPAKLRAWVIIGSMVELEAKLDSERKRIAGVIYNRLLKGMPLQIDATVHYALKQRRLLTYEDYRIDHPYNTYKIPALPPGPICSPRAESVIAASQPEKHNFYYYVAMPDGSHRFAKTYEEHLANVAHSRRARAAAL